MAQEVKGRITELYRGRYEGFGPVLFAEKLEAEHEISIDHLGGAAFARKRRAVEGDEKAEKAAQGLAGEAASFWRCRRMGRIIAGLRIEGESAV